MEKEMPAFMQCGQESYKIPYIEPQREKLKMPSSEIFSCLILGILTIHACEYQEEKGERVICEPSNWSCLY